MDLESAAEHIRGVLDGSAPEVQRRLLQELLDSVPAHAGPSIEAAEDYLKIFRHLLFSAFFPHVGNPTPPRNNGIVPRTMARGWVFAQVQEEMIQDSWIHRACLPQTQSCARQVLVNWAWCDYPLRLPPRVLAQFGVAFSTISSPCVKLRGWDFSPPSPCADLARDYFAAFHLNWADDKKRCARQLIRLGAQDTETVIGADGVELDPPSSSGAVVPPVPPELHDHRPRLRMLDRAVLLNLDHRQMDEDEDPETIPNATTPKRNREETDVPIGSEDPMERQGDSKRMHVDSQVAVANQFFRA